jgi:quercetin 2,3-dioxygenase
MIQIIPSKQRHHADHGWLDTHWHFSFGDYHDETNMNWGALRVFNDDIIQGGGGFDFHPHRDMEIVTVVLRGSLEHQDNLGNKGTIQPGEVQVMSAGKGIYHSEQNQSEKNPVHLLQLWILPRHRGNAPRWGQKHFDRRQRLDKLFPVVSGGDMADTLTIDQDAQIYLSSLSKDHQITHAIEPERKGYLFVIAGEIDLNGKKLAKGDQAKIAEESELKFSAHKDSELIFLDLPEMQIV